MGRVGYVETVEPVAGQDLTDLATVEWAEAATLLNTWHTLGMRGTGWTDIAVTDFFMPEHCTARRKIRGSRPPRESS